MQATGPPAVIPPGKLRAAHRVAACICLLCLCVSMPSRSDGASVLLIAAPEMNSPVFNRSVVLVAPHGRGAALGVILNQPITEDPARLYPDDALLRQADQLYFGGPVNTRAVVFIFRAEEAPDKAVHLLDDLYLSDDRTLLAEQLQRPRDQSGLQLYVGYAGWAPGQLQMEIMRGAWTIRDVELELLYEPGRESLWEQLTEDGEDTNWI